MFSILFNDVFNKICVLLLRPSLSYNFHHNLKKFQKQQDHKKVHAVLFTD